MQIKDSCNELSGKWWIKLDETPIAITEDYADACTICQALGKKHDTYNATIERVCDG